MSNEDFIEQDINRAARAAHEANRVICLALGDDSQPKWEDAPEWQKSSARDGVRAICHKRVKKPEDSHEGWLALKRAEGWVYGEKKDPEVKTHPCMVPYDQLPPEQRLKDDAFLSVVRAFFGMPSEPLWCIHVRGPGSVIQQPDRETADRRAAEWNKQMAASHESAVQRVLAEGGDPALLPTLSCEVIEWGGSVEGHARGLAQHGGDPVTVTSKHPGSNPDVVSDVGVGPDGEKWPHHATLQVVTDPRDGRHVTRGKDVRVYVDGCPFAVRKMEIRVDGRREPVRAVVDVINPALCFESVGEVEIRKDPVTLAIEAAVEHRGDGAFTTTVFTTKLLEQVGAFPPSLERSLLESVLHLVLDSRPDVELVGPVWRYRP